MPSFAVVPATPDDLPSVTKLQFDACATDPGFQTIFPRGGTRAAIDHLARQWETDMDQDFSMHMMLVKDASAVSSPSSFKSPSSGGGGGGRRRQEDIVSYAVWHFYPARDPEDIEREMLMTEPLQWPADANVEVGNRLVAASVRKRHEIMSAFGKRVGLPYAYLAAIGTNPKYQKQGAASLLVKWGIDRTDDYGLPAYVEATPAAIGMYLKFGFQEVDRLKLETSPWKEGNFSNVCMIRPSIDE